MIKSTKNFTTMFFVALFMLFKVAGLHALSHHSEDVDDQHCEVCHVATAVNFVPLLPSETPEVDLPEYYFSEEKQSNLATYVVFNNQYLSSYLFTRPPPYFL